MQPKFAGALVDMDGTLYRGETPVAGAAEAVETLREAGVAVLFLTNNPTKSPDEYVETLAGMGIEASLSELFVEAGLAVTDDPAATDVVVLSLDTGLDYDLFTRVLRAVDPETPLVATNPDRTKPGTDGVVPSAGLVIGAVEGMTGREPDTVAGKPSAVAARFALDRLGVDPDECLLVGDRLDTDIEMGSNVGLTTVLVRTGVTGDAELSTSKIEPNYVLDSIADIDAVLGGR